MTNDPNMDSMSKCPVMGHGAGLRRMSNQDWWPNQVDLRILHQNSYLSDPLRLREGVQELDLEA
jgi:catalase-peroxidase